MSVVQKRRLLETEREILKDVLCWKGSPDLVFHCADGPLDSHQLLMQTHSKFLGSLFSRCQDIEWSGDFKSGQLQVQDRRISSCIEILLPDYTKAHLDNLIRLLKGESVKIRPGEDIQKLKSILSTLEIKTLQIGSLSIESNGSNSSPGTSVQSASTAIKSEVSEVLEGKQSTVQEPPIYDRIKTKQNERGNKNSRPDETGTVTQQMERDEHKVTAATADTRDPETSKLVAKKEKKRIQQKPIRKEKEKSVDIMVDIVDWTAIPCIICTEPMKVVPKRENENRRKYQEHLLNHFTETLFADVPFEKKYGCLYKNCGLEIKNRKAYIQHIAFVHNEWYKRINKKLRETPETGEDLTDQRELLQLKMFFLKDRRIIPNVTGNKSQRKPLWIEDTEVNEMDSPEEAESLENSPAELGESPQSKVQSTSVDNEDVDDIEDSSINEDTMDLSYFGSTIISESIGGPAVLPCPFCSQTIAVEVDSVADNRSRYIHHMIELHTGDVLFSEVDNSSLHCSITDCNHIASSRLDMCFHLGFSHQQFLNRLDRHIQALNNKSKVTASAVDICLENQTYEELRDSYLNDPLIADADISRAASSMTSFSVGNEGIEYRLHGGVLEVLGDELLKKLKQEEEGEQSKQKEKELTNETELDSCNESSVSCPSDIMPTFSFQHASVRSVQCPETPNPQLLKSSNNQKDVFKSNPVNILSGSEPSIVKSPQQTECVTSSDVASQDPSFIITGQQSGTTEGSGSPLVEHSVFVCKECSKFFKSQPYIISHILNIHMIHQFPGIPLGQPMYSCPEDGSTFSYWDGFITHKLMKHEEYAKNKEDLFGLIQSVEAKRAVLSGSEETLVSNMQHKEIKQEMIAQPVPVDIHDCDLSTTNWSCKLCKSSFSTEDLIRQHVVLEHLQDYFKDSVPDEKIYTCTQCHNFSSTARQSYILHLTMSHQVVEEEKIYECIKESRALLLDIDVIRCRCGRSFHSDTQLRDHIVSVHYKKRFRNIPKRLEAYICQYCALKHERRYHLIQHLVNIHKHIPDQDIEKYMPGNGNRSDLSLSEEEGDDDSSIEFNDSVSQAYLHRETRDDMLNPVLNLKCPVCSKKIVQTSNFEDHLETHGVKQEPVFLCLECDVTMSFAQQYYHVLETHPKEKIKIKCLCCGMSVAGVSGEDTISKLKTHTLNTAHGDKAELFMRNPARNLYFTFRYSCQLCSTFYKTEDNITRHGVGSRKHRRRDGFRMDPVYTCHLCSFSKAASKFADHCRGIQHGHKVEKESEQYPVKYGLSSENILYSCETCRVASNFTNIINHFKRVEVGNRRCEKLRCGACEKSWNQAETENSLAGQLTQHVHTDKHTRCVAEFINLPTTHIEFIAEYKYKCESCNFVFKTNSSLHSHAKCSKLNFRCLPCDKSLAPREMFHHTSSQTHKHALSKAKLTDAVEETELVELEDDTTAICIPDSPPEIIDQSQRPIQPREGTRRDIRPLSPTESVMEVTGMENPQENSASSSQRLTPSRKRTLPSSPAQRPDVSYKRSRAAQNQQGGVSRGVGRFSNWGADLRSTVSAPSIIEDSVVEIRIQDIQDGNANLPPEDILPVHTLEDTPHEPSRIDDTAGSSGFRAPVAPVRPAGPSSAASANRRPAGLSSAASANQLCQGKQSTRIPHRPYGQSTRPQMARTGNQLIATERRANQQPTLRAVLPMRSWTTATGGVRHFVCLTTGCGKSFVLPNDLKIHIREHEVKGDLARIKCVVCQWSEQSPELLGKLSQHILCVSHNHNRARFSASQS